MLIQIHANEKLIEKYWGGHGQKWVWTLKLAVSQKGISGINCNFWCIDTNWEKLKVTLMILGGGGQKWVWPQDSRMAVSQEGISGINWDFCCIDANWGKLKVTLIIFGWWWSKMSVASGL